MVYCFLPGKSCAIYQQTLEIIERKAEELGLKLCPDKVLTDFELATIQGIELAFPTTEVKGCLFHFSQALNPNVYELIDVFQQEQADTEVTIAQMATGSQPPKQGRTTITKDRKVEELI